MPSYTTSLRLIQPATGEYSGTWGTQVNNGITALVDASIAGTTSVTMTAANYTLTTANGATDESRAMFLVLGGTPGNSFNVIVPAVSKLYFVTNGTGFSQTVKTPSGSGISVPNGARMTLRCDGTDVLVAQNYFASLSLGAALPTASGGTGLTSFTANGVVYASSTSALATGSGLVFDGTNLGVGTSSPGSKLQVSGSTAAGAVAARVSNTDATGMSTVEFTDGANTKGQIWAGNGSYGSFGGAGSLNYSANSGPHVWYTNYNTGGERMRLDASGNLGIGTTSPVSALGFGETVSATGITFQSTNTTFNSGKVAVVKASVAGSGNGAMVFETYAGGSGGGERMRLDSSGNLGLGVTPSANAYGSAKTFFVSGDSANGLLALSEESISATSQYVSLMNNAYPDGSSVYKYKKSSQVATSYRQNDGAHAWLTAPSGTAGNTISFTQAMTLDASGNLDLGTTGGVDRYQNIIATSAKLTFNAGTGFTGSAATSIYNQSAIAMVFGTNNTERARITSGGDLLVGTTTTPSSSNAGFVVAKDADGTYLRNACTITTARTHFEFVNGNGTVGTISTNASATAYNTSSDRRLKEGIAPAADAGPIIDAIEVVQHDWKVGGHTRFGVIAQDLNAVAPEAVSAGDDGEEIEKTWGVDYSKLVPMLIKEIQSLRARVAALEQA